MEELLLDLDSVRIVRLQRKNATSLERWTLSTQGLEALGHAEIVVNRAPDELCPGLAHVLQQLTEHVSKGHKFGARDQMNLGLGRVTFRKFKQGHIELIDDHVTRSDDDAEPPAMQFLLALAIDAGWFYFKHQAFEEGMRFFQVALQYDKKSVSTLYGMGLCSVRLGDLLGATQSLDQATEAAEKRFDSVLPQLLFQRGLLYHERALAEGADGDPQQLVPRLIEHALSDFQSSLKWEESAEVLFHRARTHRLRGDDTSTEQDIQRIVALNPRLNPPVLRIAVTESHQQRTSFVGFDPAEPPNLREILELYE